jgi:hypothetical protein
MINKILTISGILAAVLVLAGLIIAIRETARINYIINDLDYERYI